MARVLVGEDDYEIRGLYLLFLPMGNHEVVVASTRFEVMEQFDLFKPDIILLDIMLNGDDGRQICREIKLFDNNMKVILLSANPVMLSTYIEYNADAAIEKPFSLKDVLNQIDTLLSYGAADLKNAS